tara:strand:- start:2141 stop:2677 length:537 start_codon:yes stop_codon:yes gene_type:complete
MNPFSSGFSLPAPISPSDVLGRRRQRSFGKGRVRALRRSNILIIEDDIELANMFQLIGKEKNWPLLVAGSSSEALGYIAKREFDALILDWNLPDFNGDALVRLSDELLKDHCTKHNYDLVTQVPIITHSSEKQKKLNLGWSEYFSHVGHWDKPLSYDHLMKNCEQLIYKSQAQIIEGA